MATLTFRPPMEQDASSRDEAGLTELRVETLRTLLAAIFILGCVAMNLSLAVLMASTSSDWRPLPILEGLLGLMLTAAVSYVTLCRGPIVATAIMLIGLTLTLTGAIFLSPGSTLATFFVLIVLAAT